MRARMRGNWRMHRAWEALVGAEPADCQNERRGERRGGREPGARRGARLVAVVARGGWRRRDTF
jgi:hypothetical protein